MARPLNSSCSSVTIAMISSEAAKAVPTIGTTLGKYGSEGTTAAEKMRASAGR